jgi:hypothetical protein
MGMGGYAGKDLLTPETLLIFTLNQNKAKGISNGYGMDGQQSIL